MTVSPAEKDSSAARAANSDICGSLRKAASGPSSPPSRAPPGALAGRAGAGRRVATPGAGLPGLRTGSPGSASRGAAGCRTPVPGSGARRGAAGSGRPAGPGAAGSCGDVTSPPALGCTSAAAGPSPGRSAPVRRASFGRSRSGRRSRSRTCGPGRGAGLDRPVPRGAEPCGDVVPRRAQGRHLRRSRHHEPPRCFCYRRATLAVAFEAYGGFPASHLHSRGCTRVASIGPVRQGAAHRTSGGFFDSERSAPVRNKIGTFECRYSLRPQPTVA